MASPSAKAERPQLPAWASWQQISPVEWPDRFYGQVLDEQGMAVDGAEVRMSVKAVLYVTGGSVELPVYDGVSTKTNDQGRYEFGTDGIPVVAHRPLTVVITASSPGYVPVTNAAWCGLRESQPNAEIRAINLLRERLYEGRCFNPDGRPASDAVLFAYGTSSLSGDWADCVVRVDGDGRYHFRGPMEMTGCWFQSSQGAPRFATGNAIGNPEQPLRLESGTAVGGVLLDTEGKPCPGVIIVAKGSHPYFSETSAISNHVMTRTDLDGRFQFATPLKGEYYLLTTAGAYQKSVRDSEVAIAEKVPSAILPHWQTFGNEKSVNLTLQAVRTEIIEGKVRFPDGSPATTVVVRIHQMPGRNGVLGVDLGRTFTDQNGEYRFHVPSGIERVLIQVESVRRGGDYYTAYEETTDKKDFEIDRVVGEEKINFSYRLK